MGKKGKYDKDVPIDSKLLQQASVQ